MSAAPRLLGPAYSSQDTLKMVAGMFEASVHETYTREEVVSIVEDVIRVGRPTSSIPSTDGAHDDSVSAADVKGILAVTSTTGGSAAK